MEYTSFDAYNGVGNLKDIIERFYQREGHYPARVLADKTYRTRENLAYCKARGIRLSGPHWADPERVKSATRHRITATSASV